MLLRHVVDGNPYLLEVEARVVRHPKVGHRIENLTRELYPDSLAVEGPTSHTSTDHHLVAEDGVFGLATLAVA